jgi:hypothetical protein
VTLSSPRIAPAFDFHWLAGQQGAFPARHRLSLGKAFSLCTPSLPHISENIWYTLGVAIEMNPKPIVFSGLKN